MALLAIRPFIDSYLQIANDKNEVQLNHIFEPEYHQDLYRNACIEASNCNSFQLNNIDWVEREPNRGFQPIYSDSDDDPESIIYVGMIDKDGNTISQDQTDNICALKSISIRWGYINFDVARSVSREYYNKRKDKGSVVNGDLLINSTGDGTIGRMAVYDREFPALVDGHITIVRFREKDMAWYTAAYLLSPQGQRQIYRYINGSSGQVEIYPQDISRLWIPIPEKHVLHEIVSRYKNACKKYSEFYHELRSVLSLI